MGKGECFDFGKKEMIAKVKENYRKGKAQRDKQKAKKPRK